MKRILILMVIFLSLFSYADDRFNSWLKAANAGNSNAQYLVALSYQQGLHVVRANDLAIYWHRQAASQGNRKLFMI
jgi:TPR repeat protein